MIVLEGLAFAIYGDALMPWRFDGYGAERKRPAGGTAQVLTPPSIIGRDGRRKRLDAWGSLRPKRRMFACAEIGAGRN